MPAEPLSVGVDLTVWGLSDASTIRSAQLSVIRGEAGDRLSVYYVSSVAGEEPPTEFRGRGGDAQTGMLLISTFDYGNRNQLGGYFAPFADAESEAEAMLAEAPDGSRALKLECRKAEDGYCGVWVHTFDLNDRPDDRWYLDVRQFGALGFWICGVPGTEVDLRIADAEWEMREDSRLVGPVAQFLPADRLTDDWQFARVPLAKFPDRLDPATVASIVFQQVSSGDGQFFVSGLALLGDGGIVPPRPAPAGGPAAGRPRHRATWIWNTAELIEQPQKRDSLVRFLSSLGFDRAFLQLPDGAEEPTRPGEVVFDFEALRPIVASLNAAGIGVFALDGFAGYARPVYHEGVLRTVDRVVAYNRSAAPSERFLGIRYDIEPYLLPGFHGPAREEILVGFLDLISAMSERTSQAGLTLGVDIPFWYDERNRLSGESITVAHRGVRKPVSRHVIDMVDEVAIMAYRTMAYGADGVIRHSVGELQYAADAGKDVLVGVETHPLPDEELIEVTGPSRSGWPEKGLRGGAVVVIQSGDSARFVLLGEGPVVADETPVPEGKQVSWWPVTRRIPVPANKLSFARLGYGRLHDVLEQSLVELSGYPSFAGFAIHNSESFRVLLNQSAGGPAETGPGAERD